MIILIYINIIIWNLKFLFNELAFYPIVFNLIKILKKRNKMGNNCAKISKADNYLQQDLEGVAERKSL